VTVDLLIALAEGVPVILYKRRRHCRIAEAGMAGRVRRRAARDVTLSGIHAIMVALLRDLGSRRGRWRRWIIRRRLRMGASGKCNGEQ
jgi:hypothetical protein